MANSKKQTAAKKQPETKIIRRRNEKNEVVEIEVPVEPMEKAQFKPFTDHRNDLLDRRKHVTDQIRKMEKSGIVNDKRKEVLGALVKAVDKRLASL